MSNEIRNNINVNKKFFRQIVLTLYNNIYNLFKAKLSVEEIMSKNIFSK